MRTLRVAVLCALFAAAVFSTSSARDRIEPVQAESTRRPVRSSTALGPSNAGALSSGGAVDTFVVAEFEFDGPGGTCDPQGWYGVDRTVAAGVFFHVDDFAGMGGGSFGRLVPLQGAQSLWCGARADSTSEFVCNYDSPPGYGNHWSQRFESAAIPVAGDATISYQISWDSEELYDYTYVEYVDGGGGWVELASYTGVGSATETWVIPANDLPDSLKLRFRFESDAAYSDEDQYLDTDGAVIVDSLVLADTTGVLDYQDFEAEAPGDSATADGIWHASAGPGYGDFAGLFPGTQLVQEDPCISNLSCVWGFFQGSEYDYSCGGHPEQLVVPFGNDKGQYIDNQIWSPWLDWTHDKDGAPVPGTASIGYLEYDVYLDLPLDNLIFHRWFVRGRTNGGCPTPWLSDGFFYNGLDEPEWRLGWRGAVLVTSLLPPDVTEVQLSIGVYDCRTECGGIGSGSCHSHAPLIDNVRLVRLDPQGPIWEQTRFTAFRYLTELFQDNFAETEDYTRLGTGEFTSSGKVRVDIGFDISDRFAPYTLLGDSLVISVTDPNVGLDRDAGGGPAAYIHVKDLPGKSGAVLSGGPQWPYAPSVSGGGWSAVRMDSIPLTRYPEDRFCVDLNDNLYEPGDTIFYYLSARNANGVTTYWSETTGTTSSEAAVRAHPMEMTCLPANALTGVTDILLVNVRDGGAAQAYFEHDFGRLGIKPDRYDIQKNTFTINNGLAHGVKDVTQQLIPYYKKIIWSSGDLTEELIGDGESPDRKSNDFELLYEFLDQHTEECGVYFTGDNLAGDIATLDGAWATSFRNTFLNFQLTSGDHAAIGEPPSPTVVGQSGSLFDGPGGGDSLIAFEACPAIRTFDVLAPYQNSSLAMAYSDNPGHGAVLGGEAFNADSLVARVLLSGFGYGAIRDDRAQSPYDRVVHLQTILQWLGNDVAAPTAASSPPPLENGLAQNYPNPFNPTTTIRYSARARSHVSIRIYNVAGQLVRTLVDGVTTPGVHDVVWNGRDNAGEPVSSGVYLYRMVAGDYTRTRKMVVIK